VRKWWKRLAAALAIAGALLVVVALGAPLWLRGPRLSRVVERATESLCGTVRVQGGRLAVTAIFDFLLGRATFFEIDGLQVVAPDGEEVLVAAKVSARVRARWSPWRIDVYDLRLSSVRWLFVEHPGERRIDFVDVFRQVAPGASRQTCIAPRPRPAAHTFGKTRPAPPPAPPLSLSVQVHNTLLEDVNLRLDFKTWALVLEGTWAEGSVGFSTTPGPRLTFEARGIEARRGGLLRVGMRDQQWAAVIPLDHVQIDRYATDPGAPADMLLDVGRASTGRSALSGHARFTDVFPWGRRSRTAGMEMDARWSQIGDAIERLKQAWGITRRMPGRLDADLTAQLRGPFEALTGRMHVAGPRAQLDLGVERNARLDAALQVDAVETDGVLDPALQPFLAGRMSGHLRAHVDVVKRVAALDEATLRLDRSRPGPWPRRLTVSTHAPVGPFPPNELDLFLKDARFEEGTLAVTEVRGMLAEAAVRGTFAMRLLDEGGALLRPPHVSASGETRSLDLGRLVPGGLVQGTLTMSGQVRGPVDDLAIGARFPPGTSIEVVGLPVALPARVSARLLRGEQLLLPTVRLGDPEGGAVEVGGKMVFDGAIDAQLAVLRLPLDRLAALVGVPISGVIDSGLRVTGDARQPRVAGQVAFSQIRVGDTLLGDGAINLVPQGRATLIDGRIVPALGVHGRLDFERGPALSARVDVRDLPLATFASAVPGLTGQLSGQADVRASGRSVAADGTVESVALAYRLGKTELQLRSTAPARLRAAEDRVVLEPLRLEGSGLQAVAEGRLERGGLHAGVRGQVALAALGPALQPVIKETAGVLQFEVRAEGAPRAPQVSGQVSVREPLRVWPAALLVPVQVPGGRIDFDGRRIAARALALSLASVGVQIDGTAELAPVLGDTRLDARVTGAVEGAALARRLPQLLGSGKGRATLDGRLTGTLAVPSFEGHADLAGFGVMVPGAPVELKSADGRIEAHGHTLSTSNLTLDLAPAGRLQIGSPQAPAVVEVTSVDPPDVAGLAVRLRGRDLATAAQISGLRVHDLDLQLGLDHTAAGPLRIGGDVWIDGATLQPTEIKTPPARGGASLRAGARVAKEIFPDIQVDVGVHSRAGGLEVVVPYLPDLAVTLDCRVKGSLKRPKVDGRARGDGLYSRMVIFLVDLFTDAHVRRCGAR
jgi:hypothetical protein